MVNMGWEYPAQLLQQSAARLPEAMPGHAAEAAGRGGRHHVPTHAVRPLPYTLPPDTLPAVTTPYLTPLLSLIMVRFSRQQDREGTPV